MQKGGAGPNNTTTKIAQQGTQGACETSILSLISRVSKCPTFAGCQQSGRPMLLGVRPPVQCIHILECSPKSRRHQERMNLTMYRHLPIPWSLAFSQVRQNEQ